MGKVRYQITLEEYKQRHGYRSDTEPCYSTAIDPTFKNACALKFTLNFACRIFSTISTRSDIFQSVSVAQKLESYFNDDNHQASCLMFRFTYQNTYCTHLESKKENYDCELSVQLTIKFKVFSFPFAASNLQIP